MTAETIETAVADADAAPLHLLLTDAGTSTVPLTLTSRPARLNAGQRE